MNCSLHAMYKKRLSNCIGIQTWMDLRLDGVRNRERVLVGNECDSRGPGEMVYVINYVYELQQA